MCNVKMALKLLFSYKSLWKIQLENTYSIVVNVFYNLQLNKSRYFNSKGTLLCNPLN